MRTTSRSCTTEIVMDTMPGKKGKGIKVKIEYTIAGEYKTYQD